MARVGLSEVARRRGYYELALQQIDAGLADDRMDAVDTPVALERTREKLVREQIRVAELEDAVKTWTAITRGERRAGPHLRRTAVGGGGRSSCNATRRKEPRGARDAGVHAVPRRPFPRGARDVLRAFPRRRTRRCC